MYYLSLTLLIFYLSSLLSVFLISLTEIIDYESRTIVTFN